MANGERAARQLDWVGDVGLFWNVISQHCGAVWGRRRRRHRLWCRAAGMSSHNRRRRRRGRGRRLLGGHPGEDEEHEARGRHGGNKCAIADCTPGPSEGNHTSCYSTDIRYHPHPTSTQHTSSRCGGTLDLQRSPRLATVATVPHDPPSSPMVASEAVKNSNSLAKCTK